ncbi:MAG: DUF4230 domain-containing protein [Thermoflexales bacterium]|nr:DUF4230 domain-containing protein [Thermoflexales bacterium]
MLRGKAFLFLVAAAAIACVSLWSALSYSLYTGQQQASQQRATGTSLAIAGTEQAVQVTAQAAMTTLEAQNAVTAQVARATSDARDTATAQAARATSDARNTAIAQAATATGETRAAATRSAIATANAQATAEIRTQLLYKALYKMRQTSELTVYVFSMQAVVKVSQPNEPVLGIFPLAPTELIYKAYGEVRAGFDLSAITQSDVEITGNAVTIRLPPPRILAKAVDPAKSEVYNENVPWFGRLEAETVERAHQASLEEIVKEACHQHILDRANQGAGQSLEQLLEALGFETVTVVTQPAQTCP